MDETKWELLSARNEIECLKRDYNELRAAAKTLADLWLRYNALRLRTSLSINEGRELSTLPDAISNQAAEVLRLCGGRR